VRESERVDRDLMVLRWKGGVCSFDNKIREVSVWFETKGDVYVI
jgi:hypothetical protein